MFQESLETAIPTAFENADIGITSSEADSSSSGFAVYVDVLAEFDDTDVTAEEFRTMLQLIVENAHVSNFHGISVFASGPNNATISLGARGTELGFPDQDATGGFSADWDDVVAFLKE
jgi:mevalonate pyrophosphate decarboxylase